MAIPTARAGKKRSPIIEAPNNVSDTRAMKGVTGGYTTYPPAEEPSVVNCGQLVAMESVLAVGRGVQRNYRESRQNEDASIAGDDPLGSGGQPHQYRNHYNADQRTLASCVEHATGS